MAKAKARPKADALLDHLFTFWGGRLTEISLALDRARVGPLPPFVLKEVHEAFYALNRAQANLRMEIRPVPRRAKRKARR